MKKSLSLILAIAMVFSMFTSAAFAAEASLDAQAKFDALKKLGIFEGYSDGSAGLDREMTRAEYAAVLVRLFNLKKDSSKNSYTDTADHWAHKDGYIEAVTAAKFMEGPAAGKFDPDGKVTIEQLATIMVRALNLEVDKDAKVEGTVSDWAKAYVAAAVKAGLISNTTDFTVNAKRDVLVSATYVANEMKPAAQPDKIGISEAKASGAKQITVKLNGSVDTEKAKLEVAREGSAVKVTEVKWDDKKSTATLILESPIIDATYTVTLSGIDKLDDSKKSAEFKGEDEKIVKIEFTNASDTIAQPEYDDSASSPFGEDHDTVFIRVPFEALNQYGEKASTVTASDFDIKSSLKNGDFQEVSDQLAVDLFLAKEDIGGDEEYDRGERISITVTHDKTGLSTTKLYTIGDRQNVSKVEIGDLMDESGKNLETLKINKYGYLGLTAYDQYGFKVYTESTLDRYISTLASDSDIEFGTVTAGKGDDETRFDTDVNDDDQFDLKFYATSDVDPGEYEISLLAGGQSLSKTIKIVDYAKPASLAFASDIVSVAKGDGTSNDSDAANYRKFVKLIAKNADGVELTPDEIVDAVANEDIEIDENGEIDIVQHGGLNVVTSGIHKGEIEILPDDNGTGTLTAWLEETPNNKITKNIRVGDERRPTEIKIAKEDYTKALPYIGSGKEPEVNVTFQVLDQYGNLALIPDTTTTVEVDDEDYRYAVKLTFWETSATSTGTATQLRGAQTDATLGSSGTVVAEEDDRMTAGTSAAKATYYYNLKDFNNREFRFYVGSKIATYKVEAELIKQKDGDTTWSKVDSKTKTLEVVDPDDNTFTVYPIVVGAVKDGENVVVRDIDEVLTTADLNTLKAGTIANFRKLGKEIKLEAKDSSGEKYAVGNAITNITSSNSNVLFAAKHTDGKAFVWGLDDEQANATVTFDAYGTDGKKRTQTQSISFVGKTADYSYGPVTVKRDSRSITIAKANALSGVAYLWEEELFGDIKLTEKTYGNSFGGNHWLNFRPGSTYDNKDLDTYGEYLGLTYTVVSTENAANTFNANGLSINPASGIVTFANAGSLVPESYTIRIQTPSGEYKDVELEIE